MATTSFEELMQQIADLAARAVPAAFTCGITLAQDGHVITVASADALARLLDEQQYELDQGPCLQALDTANIVSAENLTREARWDSYPPRALAHGIRAIYSSPLLVNDQAIGALNTAARSRRSTCCAPCRRTATSRFARLPPSWSPRPATGQLRPDRLGLTTPRGRTRALTPVLC